MKSPIKNMAYWKAKNSPTKQKRAPKSTDLDKLMENATKFEGTKKVTDLEKEREKYGWEGSEKLEEGIKSGDVKKVDDKKVDE